jgi:hypothetical protein
LSKAQEVLLPMGILSHSAPPNGRGPVDAAFK